VRRARKGYDQLKRIYERQIVETIELRSVRTLGFTNAETIAHKIVALFEAGEFDVCTLFFSRFRSVIAQGPDRAADHTRRRPGADRQPVRARPMNTSRTRRTSCPSSCRGYVATQVFRALSGKRRLVRAGRPHERE